MNFTLIYKGPLHTRADASQKQEIRRQFHPQLKELWTTRYSHRTEVGGYLTIDNQPLNAVVGRTSISQIARNNEICGVGFVPLVTEQLALACKLNIFFLSKGLHQRIVENADFDNRLKSLFDGLRRPNNRDEMGGWTPTDDEKPFYCLLANDALITDIKIAGDSLLDPSVTDNDHYHLFIRVKIRPLRLTQLNADLI